jgi:LacI family transcriptional regulator
MSEHVKVPPKRPTLEDVARQAGVSISTVDRVVSGRLPVRQATAAQVLAAAEELGFYATNLIRSRLKTELPVRKFGFVLQQDYMPFYASLGESLKAAAQACTTAHVSTEIDFAEDIEPHIVAERIERLGAVCDALAVVAADHPAISQTIEALAAQDVPVFAAVSDLSSERCAGYVGTDNFKLGRVAAWMVSKIAEKGEVAIFIGTHRFLCQEMRVSGFQSFLNEMASRFTLLEPFLTCEDEKHAYEAASGVLRHHPGLAGLFVAGGGVRGVLKAIKEEGAGRRLCFLCDERNAETEAALRDDIVTAILEHPVDGIARALISMMADATTAPRFGRDKTILPFQIVTPESL